MRRRSSSGARALPMRSRAGAWPRRAQRRMRTRRTGRCMEARRLEITTPRYDRSIAGNVHRLKVAWTFDTGEQGGLQTNPLIVGTIAVCLHADAEGDCAGRGHGQADLDLRCRHARVAADAGLELLDRWEPQHSVRRAVELSVCARSSDGKADCQASAKEAGSICARISTEGDVTQSFAALTTPGMIYKDMIIVGFRAPETQPALHGDIRAYDVHTGKLRWIFHTIPYPGEPGYETWPKDAWKVTGSANNWAGMALDEKRGIVYVPTGSAVNGLLRCGPHRGRSVCEYAAGSRRKHGKAHLGLSGCAPRHMGSRLSLLHRPC